MSAPMVLCPECRQTRQRSRVRVGPTITTCMAGDRFYDERGVFHDHDPNVRTTSYRCSLGHEWTTSTLLSCPAGDGWGER